MQAGEKKEKKKKHEGSTIRNGIDTPTLIRWGSTQKLYCASCTPNLEGQTLSC